MPLYMDVHESLQGAKKEDVAKGHEADLAKQGEYGVQYLKYWVDEEQGKVFCLVDAPDVESAARGASRGSRSRSRPHSRGERGLLRTSEGLFSQASRS